MGKRGRGGGPLEHLLLQKQDGEVRQVLALPSQSPGGKQPSVFAFPLKLLGGGGSEVDQELVAEVEVQVQIEETQFQT